MHLHDLNLYIANNKPKDLKQCREWIDAAGDNWVLIAAIAIRAIELKERERVKEFHRQRRMWAWRNGVMTWALEGDERSHAEWLGPGWLGWLRGYVKDGELFFFSGIGFSATEDDEKVVKGLIQAGEFEPGLVVWAGVIPGQEWKGERHVGHS